MQYHRTCECASPKLEAKHRDVHNNNSEHRGRLLQPLWFILISNPLDFATRSVTRFERSKKLKLLAQLGAGMQIPKHGDDSNRSFVATIGRELRSLSQADCGQK